MSTPKKSAKKSAAKSGERRQPRLMDLQRLEGEVSELKGIVGELRSQVADYRQALTTSPFAGLDLNDALLCIASVLGQVAQGQSKDYQILGRSKSALRAIEAFISGDESGLQDKPRARVKAKASGVVTKVQKSDGEKEAILEAARRIIAEQGEGPADFVAPPGGTHSLAGQVSGVKPGLNPHG